MIYMKCPNHWVFISMFMPCKAFLQIVLLSRAGSTLTLLPPDPVSEQGHLPVLPKRAALLDENHAVARA